MSSAFSWLPFVATIDRRKTAEPKKGRAVIWAVFLTAHAAANTRGLKEFRNTQTKARILGWELLDTFHAVGHSSKFLARMECSLKYAREQEQKVICEREEAEVLKGGLCLKALWIEVA